MLFPSHDPGGGGLKIQTLEALDEARAKLAKRALPEWAHDVLEGPIDLLDEQQGTMRVLNDFWDRAYDGVKSFKYNVSPKWLDSAGEISSAAKRMFSKAVREVTGDNQKTISGSDLLNVKDELQNMLMSENTRLIVTGKHCI